MRYVESGQKSIRMDETRQEPPSPDPNVGPRSETAAFARPASRRRRWSLGLLADRLKPVMDEQPTHAVRQALHPIVETLKPLPNATVGLVFSLLELTE